VACAVVRRQTCHDGRSSQMKQQSTISKLQHQQTTQSKNIKQQNSRNQRQD
jgi:hypothetical protein